MSQQSFWPPSILHVLDKHGGFTAVVPTGTLWRPGHVARHGCLGEIVQGSQKCDDFYQRNQPVTSALYRIPGYRYRVKVWWLPSGERLA